jgi:hypothetical protein
MPTRPEGASAKRKRSQWHPVGSDVRVEVKAGSR